MDYGKTMFESKIQGIGFVWSHQNVWSLNQNGFKYIYDFDEDKFTIIQGKQKVTIEEVRSEQIINIVENFE